MRGEGQGDLDLASEEEPTQDTEGAWIDGAVQVGRRVRRVKVAEAEDIQWMRLAPRTNAPSDGTVSLQELVPQFLVPQNAVRADGGEVLRFGPSGVVGEAGVATSLECSSDPADLFGSERQCRYAWPEPRCVIRASRALAASHR